MIGRGCKLDPKLISALIERWRPETHTFHLPCGACTITLEDVHLQLGLPVDGDAVTGSVHSADWGAVCYELLGAIPDNINGSQIEMDWLRDTFPEPDDNSTELEKIRYTQAYILQIIGGYLMPDLSRNLIHLRWLLKLVDFRATGEFSWGSAVLATLYREMCGAMRPNKAKIGGCLSLLQLWARFRFPFLRPRMDHPYTFPLITRWNPLASYARLPTCLEDIRLLLEQRSEAQFQLTPYEDLAIRTVISDEYLQNPNAWHVKVPLVNFAIVEMHQSDRVLRQFRFRQPITVAPEVLDDYHKIDLRQLHTDWPRFWSHYIQMWEDRYNYIPTREPIIVPELVCAPEYMPWFRIHGKPYLQSEEERQRQLCVQRERRSPLKPRRRDDDAGPSIEPTQSPGPTTGPTQSPGPTVQPSTPTAQPLQMMPAVARGIAGGAVRELFFLPIPINLWVSNTSAINDVITSTVTILSRRVILPTPTTRILAGASTTHAGSWTKEESNA
ncbi:hypothetical protein CXB51_013073 [Gossypium anomalum]|uniref:Aminotransferase-like plant mobile domain-containing protein n=1 Tax=Gossypium anomalum TaxID=47600 RepID=A0A8J5Z7U9_9ROSI|nr:hypothetical protein CXB51_013073 [Gossypium anomalum]